MRLTTISIATGFCLAWLCVSACPDNDTELGERIGQMIMVGFRGLTAPEDPISSDIAEGSVGGVILFDYDVPSKSPVRNIESPEQVRRLVGQLQLASHDPLLIAIDQEGGRISRLKEKFGFPPTLSARRLGQLNDLEVTREQARKTAQILRDLGMNLNFAPVVDLNTNPENPVIGKLERSFSADPDVVTRHAIAWIEEHHKQGILCALKHFPGHGSSRADSHLGFVDVTETWDEAELKPYREIIHAGLADAVMTAHIFNRKLDPDLPATLSHNVVTGLLRERLGFDGVVFSDDLQMKAISDHYSPETAVELCVQAGVDVLVFANNSVYDPDVGVKTAVMLERLVREGKISRERIEQSYRRIIKLKSRLKPQAERP